MRKIFTLSMVLCFLLGTGTKVFGQAAGDYVFVAADATTDTKWETLSNWKISDGANGYSGNASVLPTSSNNVYIPTGQSVSTILAKVSVSGASITKGSNIITLASPSSTITVGMAVKLTSSTVSGASVSTIVGIQPGAYVTAINGTSVTISQPATTSGSAVAFDFYPSCRNLIVNGSIICTNPLVVFGDITVNAGGTLTHGADLYCVNINNYGTFNGNNNYGSSSKNLYFGYVGAAPGNGNYTLINDGTFGDTQIRVPINGNTAGIRLIYSNQASNVTIKPSSPSVTGYAFNIAQLVPTANIKTTANTNLYIKETMSLLLRNGICFSIQQNDTCPGTTRTCTIDPGVTVYVGYNFHANRNVTTSDQGNFVYNVYGTLDLGNYCTASNVTTASAANTTDFGLCLSSVPGNTSSLTFNLGDGTQANAGSLILGSNIKLIKQKTQTINFNVNKYSTVTYMGNYGWQMNYQLLNDNVPALYMLPSKYYNLTLNGAKVVLPIKPTVQGTYTNTANGYGISNWTASVTGTTTISTSLYTATLPQGSVMYTGTRYYYVPVVRSQYNFPITSSIITRMSVPANDTIAPYIIANQYANGTNIASNSLVTAVSATTATLAATTTNQTTASTNVAVTFTGIQGTTAPTGLGTVLNPTFDGTQPLIYLGDATFSTPITTALKDITSIKANVYAANRNLIISNAEVGDMVSVFNLSGIRIASTRLTSDNASFSVEQGVYLVRINNAIAKVIVK